MKTSRKMDTEFATCSRTSSVARTLDISCTCPGRPGCSYATGSQWWFLFSGVVDVGLSGSFTGIASTIFLWILPMLPLAFLWSLSAQLLLLLLVAASSPVDSETMNSTHKQNIEFVTSYVGHSTCNRQKHNPKSNRNNHWTVEHVWLKFVQQQAPRSNLCYTKSIIVT